MNKKISCSDNSVKKNSSKLDSSKNYDIHLYIENYRAFHKEIIEPVSPEELRCYQC